MTARETVLLFKKDSQMTSSQWHRFCKRYTNKDITAVVQLIKKLYGKEMDIQSTAAIRSAMEDEIARTCHKES